MPAEQGAEAMKAMAVELLSFAAPQTDFLEKITIAMLVLLALVNSFAIVSSEGSHLLKITFYLSIMLLLTGIAFLVVPPLVSSIF